MGSGRRPGDDPLPAGREFAEERPGSLLSAEVPCRPPLAGPPERCGGILARCPVPGELKLSAEVVAALDSGSAHCRSLARHLSGRDRGSGLEAGVEFLPEQRSDAESHVEGSASEEGREDEHRDSEKGSLLPLRRRDPDRPGSGVCSLSPELLRHRPLPDRRGA